MICLFEYCFIASPYCMCLIAAILFRELKYVSKQPLPKTEICASGRNGVALNAAALPLS
jgi:hypothetical protein